MLLASVGAIAALGVLAQWLWQARQSTDWDNTFTETAPPRGTDSRISRLAVDVTEAVGGAAAPATRLHATLGHLASERLRDRRGLTATDDAGAALGARLRGIPRRTPDHPHHRRPARGVHHHPGGALSDPDPRRGRHPRGRHPHRGRTRSRRQAAEPGDRAVRHPGGRSRAHGGLPRAGQDTGGPVVRAGPRAGLRAGPVHARPAAERPDRVVPLRPAHPRLQLPQGAAVHRAAPGRRDQPHASQDAVRPARGDAGGAGHGGGRDVRAAQAVPRARHGEPRRVRRDLPPARRPSSTGSCCG